MRPGCLMKILEAERWLKGTNFREVAFLQRQGRRTASVPHPGARKVERRDAKGERDNMVAFQGGHPPFKGNSPHLRPQPSRAESSPTRSKVLSYDTGAGSRASCKLAQGRRSQTAARGARKCPAVTRFLHFRPDQWVKGRTAMQAACNRTKGAHPFDFNASSMETQAHTSCNRRAGCYVQDTAPPLAPLPCLLDCGTSTATRGNPAHDPTVPTRHIGHGSVSRGRGCDGRYGQKWAGSNGGGRRAEAAVTSSAKLTSPPGTAREPSPTA
jgi:hypothetical protein